MPGRDFTLKTNQINNYNYYRTAPLLHPGISPLVDQHHHLHDHTNSRAAPDPATNTRAGEVWEEQDTPRVPDGILYTQ